MIFVTLGTQKFQMNRLVKAIDMIASEMDEEFFIQTGHSSYKPENCGFQQFLTKDEYRAKIENCRMLITHAGVGTIIEGITAGKPVIVVPRLKAMKEHVDDHQLQIAEAFGNKGCVLCCSDTGKLKKYIQKAEKFDFQPYEVKGGNIEDIVLDFIDIFD